MDLLSKRPTEALVGPPLGLLVYSFAVGEVGLPPLVAGVFAVVCAFGPLVVSQVVDVFRRS